MTELKSTISTYESRFTSLMSEIQAIKSGSLDASIQAELRAVLARKYGKRLLDSWVPPSDEVKAAVEAGPIEEDVEVAEEKVEEMKVEAAPSPPASELSPPPSVPNDNVEQPTTVITSPTPAVMEEPTTHASKRKASQQPRGVPASKRSGRRGASPALTQPESEVASETGAPEVEAVQPEPQVEPEAEAEPDQEVEDEPASTRGRGRRVSKRGVKKAQESPAPSTRTKESSPAVSRRAPSVSSTTSATPAASTRRGKRGMRDDVVSKSVREQSAAASVKEEVEDEPDEGPNRRPSRRSFAEENKEVKRGKRGSIRSEWPDGSKGA